VNQEPNDPHDGDPETSESSPELEPGEALRSEVDRLAHHPREEIHRLYQEADEGEVGATPFITMTKVGAVVVAAFVVILALALIAYYVIG
jgi:hypothetical protein